MNKFGKEFKIEFRLTEEQNKKLIEVNELMNKCWNEKMTIEQTLIAIIGANITELLNETKERYNEE